LTNKNKIISIYDNPQLYDDIMYWKKDDIDFWYQFIKENNIKSVLELCCGTGRIGLPIINMGVNYYGIDTSFKFIEFFKSKINQYDSDKISIGDAAKFNLNQKFDLIIIGFNSIAHLLHNSEIQACFKNVYNHMHKNSTFIIDIFMPTNELTSNLSTIEVDLMDFRDTENGRYLKIYESNHYNPDTEVNNIIWDFKNKDHQTEYLYQFDMRILFPDTLHTLLADNRLIVKNFFGNYNLEPFNGNSEKQIYICTK
tara:strand:- start:55 stop:816 length:762 start_codon:yes stop_codon:yes gene_type:complete